MEKLVIYLDNGTIIDIPRKSIVHFVIGHNFETYVYMRGTTNRNTKVTNTLLTVEKIKLAKSENTIKDMIEQLKDNSVFKYEVHYGGKDVRTYIPIGITVNGLNTESIQVIEDEGEILTLKLFDRAGENNQ